MSGIDGSRTWPRSLLAISMNQIDQRHDRRA